MGFFGSTLGIGGSATDKTQVLPQTNTAVFNQSQAAIIQAIQANGAASGELLAADMDTHMPNTFSDLGEPTETALYRALSPQGLSHNELQQYTDQIGASMFDTDLTSPQSMADRARMADLFSGL